MQARNLDSKRRSIGFDFARSQRSKEFCNTIGGKADIFDAVMSAYDPKRTSKFQTRLLVRKQPLVVGFDRAVALASALL